MITRRNFIRGLVGAGLAGATVRLWGDTDVFPEGCVVRRVTVPAPAGWRGKTALFITDVHFNHGFGAAETRVLSDMVRTRCADLVLMGGDFAHTPDTDLTDFFSHWSPGCPTLFAPGNHDLNGDTHGRILFQAAEGGMTVLCNQAESWNGITFVGLPSALRWSQDLSLLGGAGLNIVLGHEPDVWDRYTQPDLLHLAGHTHGGQICPLGQAMVLPALGQKYPRGDFSLPGNRKLVVSAGIGCVGMPVRLNCPPEIIQLDFA